MNFYERFAGRLSGSVGNAMDNKADDVLKTKRNLRYAGYFDAPDDDEKNPILTRALGTWIKSYQADQGLKVDGILKPGGETERSLFETLTRRRAEDAFGPPERSTETIGFGGGFVSGAVNAMAQAQRKEIPTPIFRRVNEQELDQNLEGKPIEYHATGRMMRPCTADQPLAPVPPRKPETISPTHKGQEILDFIGKLESSDNYNAVYGGDKKPLTSMTIKQVLALQKEMEAKGKASTAVGRYQIINPKMNDLIKWMNIDENSIFDQNLQDKMARKLLARRGFEKFKSGEMQIEKFIYELAKQWAALPRDRTNKSYYEGDGNNKALTDFKTVKDLLEKK